MGQIGLIILVIFTHRERSILNLLILGCDSADVAEHLEISVATVNLHRRACMRKAGVRTRGEMTVYLRQNPQTRRKGGQGPIGIHPPNATCQCAPCKMERGEWEHPPVIALPLLNTSARHIVDLHKAKMNGENGGGFAPNGRLVIQG